MLKRYTDTHTQVDVTHKMIPASPVWPVATDPKAHQGVHLLPAGFDNNDTLKPSGPRRRWLRRGVTGKGGKGERAPRVTTPGDLRRGRTSSFHGRLTRSRPPINGRVCMAPRALHLLRRQLLMGGHVQHEPPNRRILAGGPGVSLARQNVVHEEVSPRGAGDQSGSRGSSLPQRCWQQLNIRVSANHALGVTPPGRLGR